MKILKNKKEIIIVIAFVVFSCIIAHFHEPWADEAQAWLIARDESAFRILFYNASYEGTFPAWILILKLCISLGLNYKYLSYVSILFVTIGVCIIAFNSKLPIGLRILLPFTYYFLYQYNIIARNYCLLIPAIALLILIYEERKEKPLLYFLDICLFSFASIHGIIISAVLFTFYFLEFIKEYIETKKINIFKIMLFILIGLIYILELITLMPRADIYMPLNIQSSYSNFGQVISSIMNLVKIMTNFQTNNIPILIINLFSFSLLIAILVNNLRNNKNKTFLIINILLLCLFITVKMTNYHFGILELMILTEAFIISNNKNMKIIIIYLILQLILSITTCYAEIHNNYSGAENMAEYMKNIENIENTRVCAIAYKSTAVLPYFNRNIFNSRNSSYYLWSINNKEYYTYVNTKEFCLEEDNVYPEYILLGEAGMNSEKSNYFKSLIENSNKYELVYESYGVIYFKGSYSEEENFYLYKIKTEK